MNLSNKIESKLRRDAKNKLKPRKRKLETGNAVLCKMQIKSQNPCTLVLTQ